MMGQASIGAGSSPMVSQFDAALAESFHARLARGWYWRVWPRSRRLSVPVLL